MGHTPGPWRAVEHQGRDVFIWDDAGTKRGYIARVNNYGTIKLAKANARLIAAAPELLAALESAYTMLKAKDYTESVLQVHGIPQAIAKAKSPA